MSLFESARGDFTHRYDVKADALYYSCENTRAVIPWNELEKILPGRGQSIYLRKRKGQPLGIWLEPEKMQTFLRELVAAWGASNRDGALKATYEYGLNERSMGWVWLVLSIFFPAFLSAMLLIDGYHMNTCMPLLRDASAKTTPARVLKVKKDRRGEMVWTIEFQTEDGKTIQGRRTSYAGMDEMGKPTGEPRVVYSPAHASCWDLSTHPLIDQNPAPGAKAAISKTELQFNTGMAWGFGALFALLGLIGIQWSVRKIRRIHPLQESVLALAKNLASARS